MTLSQCQELVRIILDDNRDEFLNISVINNAIYQAQNSIIDTAYLNHNEKVLQPLYVESGFIDNNSPVSVGDVVYLVRACKFFQNDSVTKGYTAQYLSNELFETLDTDPTVNIPKGVYFTTYNRYLDPTNPSALPTRQTIFKAYGGQPTFKYKVLYIPEPSGIVLPDEYLLKIATYAAELLIRLDQQEFQRGEPMYNGAQVDVSSTSFQ